MAETDSDPLAEQLEEQFDSDVSPDDARGQVFFGIGYMQPDVDEETREALDVLADKLKEV